MNASNPATTLLPGLEHSYAALPPEFHAAVAPTPVREPSVVVFNAPLAATLGLAGALHGVESPRLAALFSGNELPAGARPIAMAYAGHQFAHFVPQLGDGRAILLGELRAADGQLRDVQLKGAGRTPFSRGGDGRAAVGPMLREYLVSEAMFALGIPTTRSLAVVATGEPVLREEPLPGAVLARIAASHLRVGTFEYFSARGDTAGVRTLLDYASARHFPELGTGELAGAPDAPLAFLRLVSQRQAALIAQWMSVGFIHGVMNTDNMAISGETIDYGPCAFMDHYDPKAVFSSIDHRGRYAFANQPAIAQWNLARLADTLLPLIDADQATAIARATAVVEDFMPHFDVLFCNRLRHKLGLASVRDGDAELINALLSLMKEWRADFTLTFRNLAAAALGAAHQAQLREQFRDSPALHAWLDRWRARLALDARSSAAVAASMRAVNPAFIPRNHRVDAALHAAGSGDLAPFMTLLHVLQHPFDDQPAHADLLLPPREDERVLATFCGT
jgi:serine/tyrosine/threonine adenylyltransferase